jgi:hypothetical protein
MEEKRVSARWTNERRIAGFSDFAKRYASG